MNQDIIATAAAHWDRKQSDDPPRPTHWWQCRAITRHVNAKICGSPIPGVSAGSRQLLAQITNGRTFKRGISVGCGSGRKELALIRMGLVEHFDLFEIAGARIRVGRDLYAKAGHSDRATFFQGDAFELTAANTYDLVHWDGSLHHMLDVPAALEWSRRVLRDGGWITINEFIGPTQFQWSDRNLEWARRVRDMLPAELLANCRKEGAPLQPIRRPTVSHMLATDPTEAADSSRIVPAALALFPHGSWKMLGGAIYRLALSNIVGNFERVPGGQLWLRWCLAIDDLLSDSGENLDGVFIAPK